MFIQMYADGAWQTVYQTTDKAKAMRKVTKARKMGLIVRVGAL